jgi:magnesium transporter
MCIRDSLKTERIKKYPEDEDLLEDVIVENRQAIEMANIYSGILSGMMDAFASVISNNLNIVMKFLTIITIVLSVPTIIFAAYGMNLAPEGMPLSGSPYGFLVVVLASFVISIGVAVFFAKKKMY